MISEIDDLLNKISKRRSWLQRAYDDANKHLLELANMYPVPPERQAELHLYGSQVNRYSSKLDELDMIINKVGDYAN